jgi:hypothetical protein
LALGIAGAAFVLGCTSSVDSTAYGYASGGGSSSSSGGSGPPPATEIKPMLVVVDTDRTLNAAAGQGVGVFTEYTAGGHWRVWWTCDTAKTSLSCSFDALVSVTDGKISHPATLSTAPSDTITQSGPQQIEAVEATSTEKDGVEFDTDPGATITLDVSMDGTKDGKILFFVQDGKINGGYMGDLTDPLMLVPLTP